MLLKPLENKKQNSQQPWGEKNACSIDNIDLGFFHVRVADNFAFSEFCVFSQWFYHHFENDLLVFFCVLLMVLETF